MRVVLWVVRVRRVGTGKIERRERGVDGRKRRVVRVFFLFFFFFFEEIIVQRRKSEVAFSPIKTLTSQVKMCLLFISFIFVVFGCFIWKRMIRMRRMVRVRRMIRMRWMIRVRRMVSVR